MSRRWLAAVLTACLGSCGSSDDDDASQGRSCGFIGRAESCACSDGRTGAQVCQSDGTLSACTCTGQSSPSGIAGEGSGGAAETGGSLAGGQAGGANDGDGAASAGGTPGEGGTGGDANMGGSSGANAGTGGDCGGTSCGPVPECAVGDVAGCRCAGSDAGYRLCERGAFADCVCPATAGGGAGTGGASAGGGSAGGCIPDSEWCDQRDNDCNGIVDDHFACHDDAVENTRPFAGGVYLLGRAAPGSCPGLQQFWPTRRESFLSGFNCFYSDWFGFRRSDSALFYHATFSGILLDGATTDTVQPTPTCNTQVRSVFGFDARNNLHYQCGTSLMRANGELVATPIQAIAGVFDDGRTLVTRPLTATIGSPLVYVVLDPAGVELIRFPPPAFFTGSVTVRPESVTVDGNSAYVTLARVYDQMTNEILAYAIDEESRFRAVRRRIVDDFGIAQLLVSDGTIFVQNERLIRAYLPDNASRIVWRASEAISVYPDVFHEQLLTGPLAPERAP